LLSLSEEDREMHERLDAQLAELAKHVRSLDMDVAAKKAVWKWAGGVGAVVAVAFEVARVVGVI
jgi:hypothetical protein